jgi:hypothetical protein
MRRLPLLTAAGAHLSKHQIGATHHAWQPVGSS